MGKFRGFCLLFVKKAEFIGLASFNFNKNLLNDCQKMILTLQIGQLNSLRKKT